MCEKSVFCVFCEINREDKAELFLQEAGYNVISAFAERRIIVNGKIKNVLRSLVPGYVFFETEKILDGIAWREICKMQHIRYPLKYTDNEKKLRGKDLEFIHWLKGNKGVIKISKIIEIGNRINVLEGPLKDYEGKIIKINKRQKCVAVKLDGEGMENIIWLSYECVQ